MWGFNEDGYSRDSFDEDGYNSDGFDEDGYDRDGFDEDGYDRNGYDADGGYDSTGVNKDGLDINGDEAATFNVLVRMKAIADETPTKIKAYNMANKTTYIFDTIEDAHKDTNVPIEYIKRVLKGQKGSSLGYTFEVVQ